MPEPTSRQSEVLLFINNFFVQHHYAPTFREIAEQFSVSVRAAHDHVRALSRKGYIQTRQHCSRSIKLIKPPAASSTEKEMATVPIIGRVAAGVPFYSYQNFDGNVKVAHSQLPEGKHFALRVAGDSMHNAGILDGDIAIIRQQAVADNGDIVVAQVNDQVTLKRFFRERSRVRLQPENSAHTPIYSRAVTILGKLSMVLRSY